jgi:site-specific DNA recombinase
MVAQPVSQPRAAIYCRVSTAGQEEDGTSLATQEQRCREYAAERGYTVVDVYRDVHTGMELHERPHLGELRALVRGRQLDALIAYDLDRLSRDQAHIYILDDEATRHGVEVLFVTEEFDKTPIGKFMRSTKALFAEVEREKIKERTMRGKRARAESGRLLPSSRPLYGYRWVSVPRKDGNGLTHVGYQADPLTAPVVARIFAEYVAGGSLRSIAARLTAEGIPTATGNAKWAPTSVRDVLDEHRYTGEASAWRTSETRANGKRILRLRPEEERVALPAGVIPALVDAGTFAAAQARLTENRQHRGRPLADPDTGLLLRGIGRCGYCGGTLQAHRAQRRDGSYRYKYRCGQRNADRHDCPSFGIDTGKLDAEVWERLIERLTTP